MSTITMTGPEAVTYQGNPVTYASNPVAFEMLTTPIGLLRDTLVIEDQVDARSTASFRVYTATPTDQYALGRVKQIASDGTLLFGGIIDAVTEREDVNGDVWRDVQLADYTALLDRHVVAAAYTNDTAGNIIKDVLSDSAVSTVHLENFDTSLVEDGPTVAKIVFNYVTVAEALSELAQYSGYQWTVDAQKRVVFKPRDASTAPFAITDVSGNYRNLVVQRDKLEYRNKQYLRAGKDLTDARTETFTGDGEVKTFVMSFPIGAVPTVTVNGNAKTVGIRGLDDNKDFYWNKEDPVLSQDDDGTALTSSDTLSVTYQGLFPVIVVSDNLGEQQARQAIEGTSGVYASVAQDATLDDSDNAVTKAESLLAKFGSFNNGIEFETDEVVNPSAASLMAGDLISITKPSHGLEAQCLVERVSWSRSVGEGWRVQVRALTGMQTVSWLRYWRELASQQQGLVQRENEVVVIGGTTTSFTDAAAWSDTLTTASVTPESRVGYAEVGFSEVGT